MKKILSMLVSLVGIFALLVSNVNVVSAKANENPCDSRCVERVFAGQMSSTELKYLGYGNVVKASVEANDGDITYVLYLLGLWGRNSAGNVNAIYSTQIPMEAYDFYLQPDGSIFAYKVDQNDHLNKWVCFPFKPCTKVE